MKHLLLAVATLLALGSAAWAQDLSGDWRTAPDDNGHTGIIRVGVCGDAYCGTLVQAFDAAGAVMQSENVGRQIIWDTRPTGGGGSAAVSGRRTATANTPRACSSTATRWSFRVASLAAPPAAREAAGSASSKPVGRPCVPFTGRRAPQGRHCRKLAIRRRPARWLFSGWNWVPTTVSRATMAVTGPP
jgi:hypothetical protein